MSASPINVESTFILIVWVLALSFLAIAILLCFAIIIRRILRNRRAARREAMKAAFQAYLVEQMKTPEGTNLNWQDAPQCPPEEKAEVFLHYFRTLKGQSLERLQDAISGSPIETEIARSTEHGVRGIRMQAVRTLSYLTSQSSLEVIFENLSSPDKYIRLTAARCLVRRDGLCFLPCLVESLAEAFPEDHTLISSILSGFGKSAVSAIEDLVRRTDRAVIRAASLEALVMIMPEATQLDIVHLMQDEAASVRSAAMALSSVTGTDDADDAIRRGLSDDQAAVKIRAAKIACKQKRSDLTSDLYQLADDPVMWVRYWAMKAIWVSGAAGRKFVVSLSETHPMAANVDLEMRSGYV